MSAELRFLDFHGDQIPVVIHQGDVYVPMKARAEALGLDWSGQHAKFKANPRFWGMEIISIPSANGLQDTACIPARRFGAWIIGIQESRVKPEFRERLALAKDELADVLWAYQSTGAAIRPEVRAAAPQATQALFQEVEALTGVNPGPAQPGQDGYTWLNNSECANRLGLTRNTLSNRVAAWGIPVRREGGRKLLPFELCQEAIQRDPVRTDTGRGAIPHAAHGADAPDGETIREIRLVYGEVAPVVLYRLNPKVFPHPSTLLPRGAR